MDAREIIKRSIRGFFIIFTMAILSFTVFSWLLSPIRRPDGLLYGDIAMILFLSFITSQAYWIFYSKKELTKRAFSLRMAAHFLLVQVICMTCIILIFYGMGFIWGHPPVTGVIIIITGICIIYATVVLVEVFTFKKLTDDINKRLRERYRE